MKERHKDIAKSAVVGAGAGIVIGTGLRLPVVGMFADHECPERGALTVEALSGLMGAVIGVCRELRKKKYKPVPRRYEQED